jgi:hypothetical protein
MFSAEFRATLQARAKPVRTAVPRVAPLPSPEPPPLQDDSGDRSAPDDRAQAGQIHQYIDVIPKVSLALPPIPPAWNFLCNRGDAPISIALAKNALESIACYLAIRPSPDALLEAARCRSAGTLRQLIEDIYGLDAAFQLAGMQRPKPVKPLQHSQARPDAEASNELTIPRSRWDVTADQRVARWLERPEPVQPVWRARWETDDQHDGAWVG